MFDSVIRPGAVVDRAILDKEVVVGPGAIVGDGPDCDAPNRQEPGRLNTGITVVGKRAIIPRGVRIGRNVLIGEGVRAADFTSRVIRSGSTVERPHERPAGRATKAPAAPSSDGREPAGESAVRAAGEPESAGRSSSGGRRVVGETGD